MEKQWLQDYANGFKIKPRDIGIEKELPVVGKDNLLAFDVRRIFPILADQLGGELYYDDFYADSCLGVKLPDGTDVTTDAGWGILEVALPPAMDVFAAEASFSDLIDKLKDIIGGLGGIILGYGVQPLQPLDPGNWIRKRRHKIVCQNFGCIHDVNITITASDQVHISVGPEEAVRANNVMNWLTGVIIAMFANSPIIFGQVDGARLAVRERMWWFVPDDRHGVFPGPIRDLSELFQKVISMKHLVSKNGNGDYMMPKATLRSFLKKHPERDFRSELVAVEGTMWFCSRPRSMYGTIEVRPACAQPRFSSLSLAAFSLGIIENLDRVETAIESYDYPWAFCRELREWAMTDGLKAEIDDISLQEMCQKFLDLSRVGLVKRGLGEEVFLAPLEARVRCRRTLAEEVVCEFEKGGLPALVEMLAY